MELSLDELEDYMYIMLIELFCKAFRIVLRIS